MRRAIEQFSNTQQEALRKSAVVIANRMATTARRLVRSHPGEHSQTLADHIVVVPDDDRKRVLVKSVPDAHVHPANLNLWWEFGTSRMAARPYMRPALDSERDNYPREQAAAALAAGIETFK